MPMGLELFCMAFKNSHAKTNTDRPTLLAANIARSASFDYFRNRLIDYNRLTKSISK